MPDSGDMHSASGRRQPPGTAPAEFARNDRDAYASRSPDRWTLAGLLLFTLLVRGGVLSSMRGNLQQDPDAYREIAENLLRYGEFALGKPSPDDGLTSPVPTAY